MIESLKQLSTEQPIWLQVGQLLDGQSTPLKHANLVYDQEQILFVSAQDQTPPAEVLKPGQSEPDCILKNYTVLPGLIDGHTHIFLEGAELDFAKRKAYQSQDAVELLAASAERCRKLVKHGIIAMRDGGDKDGVGLFLSRHRPSGAAAEVFTPGPGINRIKRYGKFFCEPFEDFETAEQVIDNRIQRGADHIKIVPTGIINFAKAAVVAKPQYTVEEVEALTSVSHQRGKHVMAHASGSHRYRYRNRGRRGHHRTRLFRERRATATYARTRHDMGADLCTGSKTGRSCRCHGLGRTRTRKPTDHRR